MTWPNNPTWSAGLHEEIVSTERGEIFVWTIPCGNLALPSGQLVACDPFAFMRAGGNPFVTCPTGTFPVHVTLADVSKEQNRSHIREAYASIIFRSGKAAERRLLTPRRKGQSAPTLKEGEYLGFPVDTGTACFVDDALTQSCMPDESTWYEGLFENDRDDCWFVRMDDPVHIRAGIANIPLPLGRNGENLILFHSGWGDGHFPVVGSFDDQGQLTAAHIDFFVISD
jgi:hypothetical protein